MTTTNVRRDAAPSPCSHAAIRRAARYYSKRSGWTLAVMHGVNDRGHCTCGRNACDRAGKHPWPIDGRVATSNKADILDLWLAERAQANLAVATGRSGVVVLEFDLRLYGADVSHDDLFEQYPILRNAPCVFSGGDSRHYYFREPPGVAIGFHVGRLAHATDVLGGPALALLPPSIHRSGRGYTWDAGLDLRALQLPTLAGELLEAIVALDATPHATGDRALRALPGDHIARRVSILALAERLGFAPDRNGKMRCPLGGHEDAHPSFALNAKLNSWTCWSHPGGAATGGMLALPQRLGYAQGVAASAAFVESLFPATRREGPVSG